MDLGGSRWTWVDLGGSGGIWMDLGGTRWIWVDLGGSGWMSVYLEPDTFSNTGKALNRLAVCITAPFTPFSS